MGKNFGGKEHYVPGLIKIELIKIEIEYSDFFKEKISFFLHFPKIVDFMKIILGFCPFYSFKLPGIDFYCQKTYKSTLIATL